MLRLSILASGRFRVVLPWSPSACYRSATVLWTLGVLQYGTLVHVHVPEVLLRSLAEFFGATLVTGPVMVVLHCLLGRVQK
jgi:hypothetical protein